MSALTIIAEVAQAHDGSLGMAHSYIDAIATAGATCAKFQYHIADAESSNDEPFRIPFSYEDASRNDYWRRMEFSFHEWKGLKSHCDDVGLEFLCTPFSITALDALERLNVERYKVGSGDIDNFLLLDAIADTGKPVILSSGMSTFDDLDAAYARFQSSLSRVSILQCSTYYPTSAKHIGLNVLSELVERYRCAIGLSDHSGRIEPSLAAIALGAKIIEVHVAFSRSQFGPDSSSSLTIDDLKCLVDGSQFLSDAISNPIDKTQAYPNHDVKHMFGRSLTVSKSLGIGHVLSRSDLESTRPAGKGISASEYTSVIGKTLTQAKDKHSFLQPSDIR